MQRTDGAEPAQELVSGDMAPSSFTPGGDLALVTLPKAFDYDIAVAAIENGKARVEQLISGPRLAQSPDYSPDGHWLLYASDVSGRSEIYVQPYPGSGGAVPVSAGGGHSPAWHRNGREILLPLRP